MNKSEHNSHIVLTFDEVRRLTGANLLSDSAGAIMDVFVEGISTDEVYECWQQHVKQCATAINWATLMQQRNIPELQPIHTYYRPYDGGFSASIAAPMDLLYSACDLIELAWDLCVAELGQTSSNSLTVDKEARLNALKQSITEEGHPNLIKLMDHASFNQVSCLADDDEMSLGMGKHSQTWPISELPNPAAINWSLYHDVPVALITGTNGKSTSVRLAAEIAKAMGVEAGVTSTDFIKVGDHVIDEGDYSGPGGARMLLRNQNTEMAFLEVARGGLLRRGLPVSHADAALVTNVAADHLGQYGINSVDEIADVKLMVAKAINKDSSLILNADDPLLVKKAAKLQVSICWFSRHADNPIIVQQISQQKPCVFLRNNELIYSERNQWPIALLSDIPICADGTALHNIENALGVIGLCKALNISDSAIQKGLHNFGRSPQDNPGRGNLYEVNGVSVVVDFAHNEHSMQAVIKMASSMLKKQGSGRCHVMFSHAGDRSDSAIKQVTDAVYSLQPSTYILAELEEYLRGRESNEISTIVHNYLVEKEVNEEAIKHASDPLEGAKIALDGAKSGDLILLFALAKREQVQQLLLAK